MASVSVREVARHAGVSVGTVSNVLNRPEKVSPDTVSRVLASIETLGFIRNDAARQLRAGRSRTIGLVVLDVGNPFFTDVARGAEEAADAAGYAVLLGNSDQEPHRETGYLDLFDQQRVAGVLISPLGDVSERLGRLRAHGIPAVLVDRDGSDAGLCSASVDDVAGGRLAVEHLLEQGRRRIAFVGGAQDIRQVADRLEGARAAVADTPGASLEVIDVDTLTELAGRAAGERIVRRAAAARPDGVFCANDLLAVGLLQALVMLGDVRVPDDVALVGYDDIAFARATVVPLTSVRQPAALIGRTVVQMLLELADDPGAAVRQVVFQPELVVRQSSAASG
ncbi:MAG: LacI family DNA-binding transcriptional regulator [Microbacteriaceae bacterium]